MSSLLRPVSSAIQTLSGALRSQSSALSSATMASSPNDALFEHILVLNVPLPDAHRALLEKYAKTITHIPAVRTPGSVPDEEFRKATVIYGYPAGLKDWAQVPNLRFIQLDSAGADSVVRGAMWHDEQAERVVMATVAGVHMAPISQHFIMTTLALFHHLQEQIIVSQVDKRWGKDVEFGGRMFVQELRGKTVGVLGYGHIGRECARLSGAFGARVFAATSDGQKKSQTGFVEDGTGDPDGGIPERWFSTKDEVSFKEFLSGCDVLLLALPSTGATHHILSTTTIGYLPSHAIVVNIGRGDAIDTDALLQALDSKKLAGAALDVVEEEPLPDSHPLFGRKDVLITPHLSGRTTMYFERSIQICVENLRRLREGDEVWNRVDFARGY